MTVQDDARAALEELRHGRWAKAGDPKGSGDCLITASPSWHLDEAMAAVIREQYPDRICGGHSHWCGLNNYVAVVAAFNDHPGTTFADVEAVLEKVAASS